MKSKNKPKLTWKPGVRPRLAAGADIRQGLLSLPEHMADASEELIENATRILLALSKLEVRECRGIEWFRLLDPGPHLYRDKAWRAFDLLQNLGFAYCDGYDDPCDEGWVTINPVILGRYAREG